MRRILAVTISALVLLVWSSLRPAGAGPAPRFAIGDVNGDGGLDISDPIFLLRHIFADGPPPVSAGTLELEERLARLEARELTDEQRELLGYFSLGVTATGADWVQPVPTVILTGVNLQIVNGLGYTTGAPQNPAVDFLDPVIPNGAGNLIVGYQELRTASDPKSWDMRVGSHNVIVGAQHNYSSVGGILGGYRNAIESPFASVTGGTRNLSTGHFTSVTGGEGNTAGGLSSVVAGGFFNAAVGNRASALGGEWNVANGANGATVVGGSRNYAIADNATVTGGCNLVVSDGCPFTPEGNP